jgi:hypothetical protein
MHYILFYEVVSDFARKRTPYRGEHLQHALDAHKRGELVLAGALDDPVDSAVLIFRGPDGSAVERFVKADPYVKNGLVTSWRIRKWSTVVGEGATLPTVADANGQSG